MIAHALAEVSAQGEVRRRPGWFDQSGTATASCSDFTPGADRVKFAKEEWVKPASPHAPQSLGSQQRDVWQQRPDEKPRRQVRPEDDLGVPGHAALERGAAVVVGRRDVVVDHAARSETGTGSRPIAGGRRGRRPRNTSRRAGRSRRRGEGPRPDRTHSIRWRRRPLRPAVRQRAPRALAVAALGRPAGQA